MLSPNKCDICGEKFYKGDTIVDWECEKCGEMVAWHKECLLDNHSNEPKVKK